MQLSYTCKSSNTHVAVALKALEGVPATSRRPRERVKYKVDSEVQALVQPWFCFSMVDRSANRPELTVKVHS